MPLQKRRLGPARIHNRRSAWMRGAAKMPNASACPNCGTAKLSHRVCMKCGFYKGEGVLEVETEEE